MIPPALIDNPLVEKAGSIVSGTFAGIASFAISELVTGNVWIAVVLSAVSSVGVAYFSSRHKMVAAQSHADIDERKLLREEFARLWERAEKIHREEKSWLRERIDQQSKLLSLSTITKHALLGENHKLTVYADVLCDVLDEHEIKFKEFEPSQTIFAIMQEEDRIRAEIMNLPASIVPAADATKKEEQIIP